MKDFYGGVAALQSGTTDDLAGMMSHMGSRARVAVYDDTASAPRVEDVGPAPAVQFIEDLAQRVYHIAAQMGGSVPFSVIREIAENLIHAGFAEPVVSILDAGDTIRFSDQGPGISDKERAILPGYSTATSEMKMVIRGVGSGLPLVRDYLSLKGGSLTVEDNLARGAVITVSCPGRSPRPVPESGSFLAASHAPAPSLTQPSSLFHDGRSAPLVPLTTRQKHVLALVLESGSAGPSIVSRELGVGLSTAYRDLAALEDLGLIQSDSGKRTLTETGLVFLGEASKTSD